MIAEGPASERKVVGEYPEGLVASQRAYGLEVSSVQGENRVRVVVGGECHVHRVGEVEVRRAVADTERLGGAQVVLRDLRQDDTTPAHRAPQVVDRAEGTMTIDYRPPATLVEVSNPAGPPGQAAAVSSGYGLVGLRERVHALGGHLTVGPAGGGSWRLAARIPHPADTEENGTEENGTPA